MNKLREQLKKEHLEDSKVPCLSDRIRTHDGIPETDGAREADH